MHIKIPFQRNLEQICSFCGLETEEVSILESLGNIPLNWRFYLFKVVEKTEKQVRFASEMSL